MQGHLEKCLSATLALSCAVHKWDGDNPPPARAAACNGVNPIIARLLDPSGGGMLDLALTFTNEFWAAHTQHGIVEHHAAGFSSASGDYVFAGSGAR